MARFRRFALLTWFTVLRAAAESSDLRQVIRLLARVNGKYFDAHDLFKRNGDDKRADLVLLVDRLAFKD